MIQENNDTREKLQDYFKEFPVTLYPESSNVNILSHLFNSFRLSFCLTYLIFTLFHLLISCKHDGMAFFDVQKFLVYI